MRPLVGIALLLAVVVAALFLGTRSASVSRPVAVVDPGSRPDELAPTGGAEMESLPAVAPADASPERAVGRRRAAVHPVPAGTAEASDRAGATAAGAGDFLLRGSVVSAGSDEPIAGARIEAYWKTDRSRLRTAADGGFEVLVPSRRRSYLVVEAPGFVPVRGSFDPRREDAGPLVVALAPAATLGVTVVDTGGVPHSGARVRVAVKEPDSHAQPGFRLDDVHRERTDLAGRAEVRELPRDSAVSLRVEVGTAVHEESLELGGGPSVARRVVLERGGAIAGRLVYEDGTPSRYRVRLVRARRDAGPSYLPRGDPDDSTYPSADGSFRFDDLEPGTWLVGARPHEGPSAGDERGSDPSDPFEPSVLAMPVVVPRAGETVEVELVVRRGLELEPGVAHRLPVNGAPSSRTVEPGWWNR